MSSHHHVRRLPDLTDPFLLAIKPALLIRFRREVGEAWWPVGAATRGARRRTSRYVEHPEASRHRWTPCIVGRSRQLVRRAGSSNTREDSPTGRRYREHAQRGSHILLFVRRRKQDDRRVTAPYTFLGPATYVTHQGERPMSITWRLRQPMPAELFEEMKVAAG